MTNRKRKLNNKRNLTCKRLFNLNPSNNTANNDIPSLAEDIEDTETLDYEYGLQDEEHDKSSESEVENESVVEHVNVSKSPRINNSLEPSFPMYTVSKSNTNNFISNINGNDDQYIPEDDFILNGTNSNGNENYTPCSSLIDSESDDCESLVVSEASTSSNYVAKNPVPLNGLNKPESTQINNNIVNFKFNVSSLMALRKNPPQNEEEENDTVCESTTNSPVSDSVYDKKKWTQLFDLSSVMPRISSDDFIFNAVKPFHEFEINDEINDSPVDSLNESIFKIPLKRPPTRPVKTASIQPQLVSPPVLQSDEVIEIDDTISLACSSLVDDEDFEVKEEPLSRSDESSPSASSVPNAEQTVEKPANKKISFGEIPPLFRNICYYFFLYSNCKKKFCALPHNMNNGKFINNIKRASNDDLVKAFKWAREHRFFYQHIFKIMAGAFMWRKMYNMVGDMLLDVPEFVKTIDKETAVDFVLTQLQQSKNFKENLFCIINKINFAHHEALRNLMINAISKHDNLDELCDILPKLIAGKTTEMENRVVIRLMDKSLNTMQANNKRLCNLLGDLIQKKCIDFGKIPKNLSHPFGLYMRCSTNGVDILPGHIFEDKDNNAEENGSLCSYRTEDNLYYPSTTDNTENLDRLSDVDLDNLESVSQVGYVEPFHVPQETQGSNDFERTEMFVEELRRKLIGEQPPPQLPQPPQPLYFGPFASVSPNVPHTPSPVNYQQPSPLNFQQPSPSNNQQPSTSCQANVDPAPVASPEPMPIPKFGHLVLEANFKLNVSLHNSLPLSPAKGCVDLHDADIMQLDRSIKHHDGLNFLRVFDAYKTSYTQQNFVTQTIAALKSSGERSFHYFSKLLESIRSINPSWMTDKLLKAILEVVAMNIIVALEQKQCLKECVTLLLQFYDWDALITCKIFTQHFNYTIMGRYLFLAKLFSKANRFDFTFEILQSPKLKILEYQHDWPFQNCHHDLNTKNILLKDFFKYGYKYNAISTVELYKRIFQGAPVEDEILSNFNPMMKNILDNKVVPVLKQIMEDINIFEPHMERNILKAFFLIVIEKRITKSKDTHNLYLKCVKKGIYPTYGGQEPVVIIKTNYTEEEIRLTFEYYFNKIVQFPAKDVAVQISVPNETNYNEIPNVLSEKFRSFNEIYSNIREILCDDYFINIPLIANTHIAIKSSTISTVIDGLVQSYGLAKS